MNISHCLNTLVVTTYPIVRGAAVLYPIVPVRSHLRCCRRLNKQLDYSVLNSSSGFEASNLIVL